MELGRGAKAGTGASMREGRDRHERSNTEERKGLGQGVAH